MDRRLAAILAADVVGYARLIRADEEGTLSALRTLRAEVIDPAIATHHGRIVKLMGDGILAEFASVVDAVRGAAEVQQALADRNRGLPEDRRIVFRVGINLGDIVIDGEDIHGDGVNLAARLEGLAEPGGICISGGVWEQVRDRLDHPFEDLGEKSVKNIDRPIRVWGWTPADPVRERPAAAPARSADRPSIAVLPFDNMSGDPEQGYFADGIAEDIITDLSKVSGLFVIARNSSFAYRGKSQDLRSICRDLGVRYILEGSVRRAGNRVRINAQMIDGTDGGHLWAERYDRDLADIFEVQDEVTREIVEALKVALTARERSAREGRRRVVPEAYDLYVRGREAAFRFSPASIADSRALLERAVALDPDLAAAWAFLSIGYTSEHINGWTDPGDDHLTKALDMAERACGVDPSEPWAFHAHALCNMWLGRVDVAEASAERAVAINPNFAAGYAVLGQVRDMTGRHESALDCAETVLTLDPHYDIALQLRGRAQFALGRDEEAAASFERRLALRPGSDNTRVFLAALHGLAGRHEEARRQWAEIKEINPDFSVETMRQRLPYRSPAVLDRLEAGLRSAGVEA